MAITPIIFLVVSLFLQAALGELECEHLPVGMCFLAISSSGKRCLLEIDTSADGNTTFQCKTSEVEVKDMPEWIESDACVEACGVDRYTVGISSDALIEPGFTAKLCAPACYQNCPNIVDLYYNLALGEGVFLPGLCKAQETNTRREMSQTSSSSAEAYGPASFSANLAVSPASIGTTRFRSSPMLHFVAYAPGPM